MIEAVRNLHALGVPLADALEAASTVPATVLGLRDVGRIEIGGAADIVVVDDNLRIERVLVGGRNVSLPEPEAAPDPARSSSRRSTSSPRRSFGSSTTSSSTRVSRRRRGARFVDGAHRRPRIVGQRGFLRRVRVRAHALVDGVPGLDFLTVHYGTVLDMRGATAIGLSQSGRTPDVVSYLEAARRNGAYDCGTNEPASELAAVAEAVLPLDVGSEHAVAATNVPEPGCRAWPACGPRGR